MKKIFLLYTTYGRKDDLSLRQLRGVLASVNDVKTAIKKLIKNEIIDDVVAGFDFQSMESAHQLNMLSQIEVIETHLGAFEPNGGYIA